MEWLTVLISVAILAICAGRKAFVARFSMGFEAPNEAMASIAAMKAFLRVIIELDCIAFRTG
jgi:hypothetical protein